MVGRSFPVVADNIEIEFVFAVEGVATDVIVIFDSISVLTGDGIVRGADFDDIIIVFSVGSVIFTSGNISNASVIGGLSAIGAGKGVKEGQSHINTMAGSGKVGGDEKPDQKTRLRGSESKF